VGDTQPSAAGGARRCRAGHVTTTICALLLLNFAVTSLESWQNKSATIDEPTQIGAAWLQTYYCDFRCDSENPPLWNYYVAAGNGRDELKLSTPDMPWVKAMDAQGAQSLFRRALYRTAGTNPDEIFIAARRRMVVLGVLVGAVIAWWAWRLGGAVAAVVAVVAFCLDPNFLAHSSSVKNDVPITLQFVAMMAGVWLLGRRATVGRLIWVALFFGAAMPTKYSGVLAIPILGAALLCRAWLAKPWPVFGWIANTRAKRFLAAVTIGLFCVVVAYVVIWGSYRFRFSISADPERRFDWQAANIICSVYQCELQHDASPNVSDKQLRQWMDQWRPDGVIRAVQWMSNHRLLPESWLGGFQIVYGMSHARAAFLCGRINLTGWWYYFPLAILFKTPLATLVGLVLAVVVWLRRQMRRRAAREWWTLCAVAVAPAIYMAVALTAHLDIGLRYMLPVYPFLYLFLGVVTAQAWKNRPAATGTITIVLTIGLAIETISAFPNYLDFFNIAAGGSRGGLRLLSDSNLDWGQDLPLVGQWQQNHPDKSVFLFYFGAADPRYYGVKYYKTSDESTLAGAGKTAGMHIVMAVSATELQETYATADEPKNWAELRKTEPLEVLGGSIYLYELP
jgi:4-amino-4-deoxy-L-arabinose transferase-like glycosyltransferase